MGTQITPEQLAERVGIFLRWKAPMNNVTGWRAKEAEALNVSEDAFYKWYMGDNCPQAHQIVKMAGRYGAEFADMLLEPAGLETFPIGSETKRHELGRFILSLIHEHEDWATRLRDEAEAAGIKLTEPKPKLEAVK